MIALCSLLTGICPSPLPTWNSVIGTPCATRSVFFRSAAISPATRVGTPSPTRMTPFLPTARCTTSIVRLAVTAGVTVQSPRIDCSTAAAAPSCPSIAEYCACCANRPNKIIAADRPSSTPTGMRNATRPVNSPTSTNTTMMPTRAADRDRQRPLVLLVDQLGDHPDLLQPPGLGEILRAVVVNHRFCLPS